jgi:hypothetical protein
MDMALSQPDSGEAGTPATYESETELVGGKTHVEIATDFTSRLKQSKSHWEGWRQEARMLYDLIASRQWDEEDEARMKEELRPMVTFNVSGKYMDVLTGLHINNRQDIRYYPREQGDVKVNELMTGAVTWGGDLCNAQDEETDAFFDCALTGLGWMEGLMDYDLDPGGVPARQRVDNMEMFPDPTARKRNLEDAKFLIRIRYVDHEEYEELMGFEYEGSGDEDVGLDNEDDGVQFIEEPHDYPEIGPGNGNAAEKRKKCAVADYQWWKKEVRWLATAPGYGQKELTEEQYQAYEQFFEMAKARGAPMQVQKIRRKVYYRAFVSNGKVGKAGQSPYQQGFTYHAITGKRDRNKNTWYGVGRSLVDPQKWLNKFFSTILYAMMTNAKGGIMAEDGFFKDQRKAEAEWADPSSITTVNKGGLSSPGGPKFAPKPPANYPQGLDRLMEFTLSSLPQTTGMPVELMGLSERMQPGIVEAQRKQSAMSIIAWAFDAMRRYYRSVGKQMARYVIDYMPENTLVLVSGEAGRQYVPLLKQMLAVSFDIIVDEAPTSTNQQERTWLALQSLIPQALQAQIPIPPEVIKYAPIPQDLIEEWMKLLQPNPEAEQKKQMAEQLLAGKTAAETAEKQASAQLKGAQAQQIANEMQQPPEGMAELMLKKQIAEMQTNMDMRIAEMKGRTDADTEIFIARLKSETAERIAAMQTLLDARLERLRINAQTQQSQKANEAA